MKSKFFFYVIIAIFGQSVSTVLDKILLQDANYASVMFLFYLFVSVFYFAFLMYKKEVREIKELFVAKKYLLLALLVSFFAFLADVFYFLAVAIPSTAIVLIIPFRNTSNLIATVLGGKLFSEKNILYKSIVCLVMLIGVFLVIL